MCKSSANYYLEILSEGGIIGFSLIIVFFIGIIDDLLSLSPIRKLVGQISSILVLIYLANLKIDSMHGLFSIWVLPEWISVLFTIFVVVVITNAYNLIGNQLNAEVCPVGRAWEMTLNQNPQFELYSTDGSHPNIKGTYLTVCMFYACLIGESPEGIEFINDISITDEERIFLQNIAWQTFQQN